MKTSELTGAALDWAAAKAMGMVNDSVPRHSTNREYWFKPSTDWSQGGPIIEKGEIRLVCGDDKRWYAEQRLTKDNTPAFCTSYDHARGAWGPTPLIAAMRCFVTSRLGEEATIPKELE